MQLSWGNFTNILIQTFTAFYTYRLLKQSGLSQPLFLTIIIICNPFVIKWINYRDGLLVMLYLWSAQTPQLPPFSLLQLLEKIICKMLLVVLMIIRPLECLPLLLKPLSRTDWIIVMFATIGIVWFWHQHMTIYFPETFQYNSNLIWILGMHNFKDYQTLYQAVFILVYIMCNILLYLLPLPRKVRLLISIYLIHFHFYSNHLILVLYMLMVLSSYNSILEQLKPAQYIIYFTLSYVHGIGSVGFILFSQAVLRMYKYTHMINIGFVFLFTVIYHIIQVIYLVEVINICMQQKKYCLENNLQEKQECINKINKMNIGSQNSNQQFNQPQNSQQSY